MTQVAVICGGASSEAEVSRVSAKAAATALERAGHQVRILELDDQLPAALGSVDVAFPVAHGLFGEDGCLQGMLEISGVPYVGSGVLASALASDKPTAKRLFAAAGLPVALGRSVTRDENLEQAVAPIFDEIGRLLVVKPAGGGSTIGLSRFDSEVTEDELLRALALALSYDRVALVETLVEGLEVTCGVLERDGELLAFEPTLILPKAGAFYDFRSKYAPGGSEHQCPAPFEKPMNEKIREFARRAHLALGARDLSRTDMIVDPKRGEITVLELNTLPGFTSTSLFPEAAAQAGISFEELCAGLVRRALERGASERPPAPRIPSEGASP